jgi:uncharacterized protein DUF3667
MREPAIATPLSGPSLTQPPAMREREHCPSCGAEIGARFCGVCGEKRPSERVYSLKDFLHEAFEVVTNVERSFLRTLWTLVRRPGELTVAYMRGERVRYLRPLQLFFLVNVIFFFAAGPGAYAYSTLLENHLHSPYGEQARAVVLERLPKSGMTEPQYVVAFDQKTKVLARTLVIVMAPAFAIGVALLSLNRRRPAVQHLVFSIHFLGYVLLLTMAVVYLLLVLVRGWIAAGGAWVDGTFNQLTGLGMAIGTVAFLFPAYRRAYGDGKIGALVKAVVSFGLLVAILVGYRLLLFYITAYTL